MDVIISLWGYEKNQWMKKTKQIGGDEYTSDTQYWKKSVLDDYQWFHFEKMCEFEQNRKK